jgi:hypothetical protein
MTRTISLGRGYARSRARSASARVEHQTSVAGGHASQRFLGGGDKALPPAQVRRGHLRRPRCGPRGRPGWSVTADGWATAIPDRAAVWKSPSGWAARGHPAQGGTRPPTPSRAFPARRPGDVRGFDYARRGQSFWAAQLRASPLPRAVGPVFADAGGGRPQDLSAPRRRAGSVAFGGALRFDLSYPSRSIPGRPTSPQGRVTRVASCERMPLRRWRSP